MVERHHDHDKGQTHQQRRMDPKVGRRVATTDRRHGADHQRDSEDRKRLWIVEEGQHGNAEQPPYPNHGRRLQGCALAGWHGCKHEAPKQTAHQCIGDGAQHGIAGIFAFKPTAVLQPGEIGDMQANDDDDRQRSGDRQKPRRMPGQYQEHDRHHHRCGQHGRRHAHNRTQLLAQQLGAHMRRQRVRADGTIDEVVDQNKKAHAGNDAHGGNMLSST